MFNKRVGTLLALVLASSMVMSGPAAVLAASGNSGGTSQMETREDQDEEEEEKEEFEEKADDVEADVKEDKTDTGDEEEPAGEEANEPLDPEWAEEEPEEEMPAEEVNEPSEKKDKKDSAEDKKEKKDKKSDKAEKEDVVEEKEKDVPRAKDSVSGDDKNSSNVKKGPFYLTGVSTDYSYNDSEKVLTISGNRAITISGNVSGGDRIVVDSATGAGANLTLRNLKLHTTPSTNAALTVKKGPVNINLSGQNELSGVKNDSGSRIKIEGPGVLKNGRGFNGTSTQATVISGGNIQTTFSRQPKNGAGTDLYAVSINNLEYSELYNLDVKIGDSLTEYPYGKEIRSDDDGNVFMYLPLGNVRVTLGASEVFVGEVVSENGLPLRRVEPSNPSTPSGNRPTNPSGNNPPNPSGNNPGEQPDIASATDNKIFWINAGATYRSGASLQFYATGAGYSPVDPQELNPVRNSTRYVPVSWSVVGNNNQSAASGKWKKSDREVTTGGTSSGNGSYTSAEYRFKDSFTLSTNQASAVPYTLRVSYQRETYNGRAWRADNGSADTKTVSFYIRNTDITTTVTGTPRPTSTTYVRSGVTSSALRRDISSNARNARTSDDTPIGTMIFLMFAAAGSGAVIFRKKRRS